MSASPRVQRKEQPPKYYFAYRNYFPYLMKDFQGRCGYSMQHCDRAGGQKAMEVDHFNPNLAKNIRNRYTNLYLATRHCNGAKSDTWPSHEERSSGLRFLDPCSEADYGVHLFEDPETFELWGSTVEGRFHIRELDLNAPHLIRERRQRHVIRTMLRSGAPVEFTGTFTSDAPNVLEGIQAARREFELMIPDIEQRPKPKPNGSRRSTP